MSDVMQRAYRAFSPSPLTLDEQQLYVDLDEVRGSTGVVKRLATTIRLTEKPTCQILTGHRGSGKSTELRRLQHELEHPADGGKFFCVLCRADEDIDRNDVDFHDVLIAIVRQLATALRERLQVSLKSSYFKDRWLRLKNLLASEVALEELELPVGLLKLSGAIKNSPDVRSAIRKVLEPDTTNWLTAANDVIDQAILELSRQGYQGLVVIVDDLDKMIVRQQAATEYSTAEHLFIHRSGQLTAFNCHVVYTMPLEVAYSHHEQNLKNLYGGHVPVVSMTKVLFRPPSTAPFGKGMRKFQELISRRLMNADVVESDVFASDEVRDELIRLSGGQPTELMTLLREAMITELPIAANALKRARAEGRKAYSRQLRTDHWPIIEEVRRTGSVTRSKENEAAFRELLDSRALLLYMNDDEWYRPNPLVADVLPQPKAPAE